MSRSQRDKGANAERELAKILTAHGIPARRGQVFNHEPDIVTDTNLHIEVKRQETTKIGEWYRQSKNACPDGKMPVVIHRKSREPWMITLALEDYLKGRMKNDKA